MKRHCRRRQPVEDREDHRVDPHRLARAGGAGDQEVRHAREVGDVGLAADRLAERQRQHRAVLLVLRRGEQVAQVDGLALGVRQLDADGVAPRDHRDAAGRDAHRAGDVVAERHHAGGLHARRRHQLVEGDDRSGADLVDLAAHAELGQHALQHPGVLAQRAFVERGGARLRLGQHGELGQAKAALGRERQARLALARLAARRLRRGLWRADGERSGLELGLRLGLGQGRNVGARSTSADLGRRPRRGLGPRRAAARLEERDDVSAGDAKAPAGRPKTQDRHHGEAERLDRRKPDQPVQRRHRSGARIADQAAQPRRQRPDRRRGRAGERAGQQQYSGDAGRGAPAQLGAGDVRRRLGHAGDAERQQETGDDPRAQPQRLHEEVGDVGADAAQQVAGRGAGRGVEAGVVDAPAGQRQRQRTAHHRGQAAAEPRAGRMAPRAAQLIQRNL